MWCGLVVYAWFMRYDVSTDNMLDYKLEIDTRYLRSHTHILTHAPTHVPTHAHAG